MSKSKWAVTSIKLPRQLKERMQKLVDQTDETVHGFMLRAIESHTELLELRAQHLKEAEKTLQETLAGGLVHEADAVHDYIRKRKKGGKNTPLPRGKPWRG